MIAEICCFLMAAAAPVVQIGREDAFAMWITSSVSERRRGDIKGPQLDSMDQTFLQARWDEACGHDIDVLGETCLPSARASKNKLLGLAVMMYKGEYDILQNTPERRAAINWFGGQTEHMHFFDVFDTLRLVEPLDVVHAGFGVEQPKHLCFTLTPECLERVMAARAYCRGDASLPVREILIEWRRLGCSLRQAEDYLSVLQLPHPISCLCVAGSWECVGLDARARVSRTSSFSQMWRSLGCARAQVVQRPMAVEGEGHGENPAPLEAEDSRVMQSFLSGSSVVPSS